MASISRHTKRTLVRDEFSNKRLGQTDFALQIRSDDRQLLVGISGKTSKVSCLVWIWIVYYGFVINVKRHSPPLLCYGNKMMQFAICYLGFVFDSSCSNKP